MKKSLMKVIGMILTTAMIFTAFSAQTFAFSKSSHEYVTGKGADLLISTMGSTYSTFYSSTIIGTLKTYSCKPDEDETDGINKWHFYNPSTGKNFMSENKSALTQFSDHYSNAVNYYSQGDTTNAWKSLGRALHYLEDLNTPVHTNSQSLLDAGTGLKSHIDFESKVVEIQSDYTATMTTYQYRYYKNNDVNTIGKASASLANDNFSAMKNGTSTVTTVAGNSLTNAQKAVSGVLYKFYLDVN